MTLYTSMPLELVLQGIHEERNTGIEIMYNRVRLQVEPIAPGIGKVIRILDGNLNDYLRPELTPGNTLLYGQPAVNNEQNRA